MALFKVTLMDMQFSHESGNAEDEEKKQKQ